MRTSTLILSGLLIAQLTVTAKIHRSDQQQRQQLNEERSLLAITPAEVDSLVISDGTNSVRLHKADGGWVLPEQQDLPANSGKVTSLLSTVSRLKTSWPVATTDASARQLEVASDNYQRHLQLFAGDNELGELYLGSSPGFRKAHLRRGDESVIYSAELNSFDLAASGDEWLDKSILSAPDLSRIEGPDFTLEKTEDAWQQAGTSGPAEPELANGDVQQPESADSATQVDDTADGVVESGNKIAHLTPEKAQQLAQALSTLQVQGVADTVAEDATLSISATGDSGELTYQFTEANGQYLVSRSDRDVVFTLSKFDYDRIAEFAPAQIAMEVPEGNSESSDSQEGNAEVQIEAENASNG